ncbi:hypothetical protein FKM82_022336 [Ascaphus truei]
MKYEKANVKSTYTPLDLFRTPEMRRRTLCFMLVWFALGFAFFGVALDLDNFGVSVFLVQVLFGAMDIPARLITGLSMSYIGRRVTQSVSLILAGLLILTNMFISKGELQAPYLLTTSSGASLHSPLPSPELCSLTVSPRTPQSQCIPRSSGASLHPTELSSLTVSPCAAHPH